MNTRENEYNILFRNEKGSGAKMCPSIIVSGIITVIDQFFPCTSSESQNSSRNLTQASFIHIFKVANIWVIKRTNECLNERMNERLNEWLSERMNKWMSEWKNEWMNEWINEWVNEKMNEWMNDQWNNDLPTFLYHLQSHISSSCHYPRNTKFWCTRW